MSVNKLLKIAKKYEGILKSAQMSTTITKHPIIEAAERSIKTPAIRVQLKQLKDKLKEQGAEFNAFSVKLGATSQKEPVFEIEFQPYSFGNQDAVNAIMNVLNQYKPRLQTLFGSIPEKYKVGEFEMNTFPVTPMDWQKDIE